MTRNAKVILAIAAVIVLPVILVLSIIGYIFSDVLIEGYAPLEVKKAPQKNPDSYVFDGNLEEVRRKIVSGVKYRDSEQPFPFKDSYSEENDTGLSMPLNFSICGAPNEPCFVSSDGKYKEILGKEENKNDLYLASDGSTMYSSTYYAAGKPLKFRTDFHIHLESQTDNKVKVTISGINPVIYKGYGGMGLHGAILRKQIPAEPTGVEEYQLLRYIGSVLGEKSMPEVIFPG